MNCKKCFDSWKVQMGRKPICPSCKAEKEPKKLPKLLLDYRDTLMVVCGKEDCPRGKEEMTFGEYV